MSDGTSNGRRALEGVRVIDLTWLQVGPQATRLLATFGAQVIRVEWRERKAIDFIRYVPPFAPDHATADGGRSQGLTPRGRGIQRQLRSRAAISTTPIPASTASRSTSIIRRGATCCDALVRDANVICENFSPGQMDKWGLGYEDLRKLNPRIIYIQTTGSGKAGVYKDYVSYGPTAQAFSGLTYLSGLPEPRPPAGWGYSYLDHSPGYFGAIMLMAAIRRQRQSRRRMLHRHVAERDRPDALGDLDAGASADRKAYCALWKPDALRSTGRRTARIDARVMTTG